MRVAPQRLRIPVFPGGRVPAPRGLGQAWTAECGVRAPRTPEARRKISPFKSSWIVSVLLLVVVAGLRAAAPAPSATVTIRVAEAGTPIGPAMSVQVIGVTRRQ